MKHLVVSIVICSVMLMTQRIDFFEEVSITYFNLDQAIILFGNGAVLINDRNGVVNGVAFAPNQTSNYVLTGSDSLGCVGIDTAMVTVLDNASSTINQTAIDSFILNDQTYTQSGIYTQVMVKF